MTPGKLYDALRTAGVPDDKAREAAEEVADDERISPTLALTCAC